MRNLATIAGFALLLAVGAYGVFGGLPRGGDRPAAGTPAVAAGVEEHGRPTGSFDSKMSGVCKFACAAPPDYDPKDVTLQPGATDGGLTQCPVSGVVFVVDHQRPRIALATGEYVLCCEGCVKRFQKDPGRFVNL